MRDGRAPLDGSQSANAMQINHASRSQDFSQGDGRAGLHLVVSWTAKNLDNSTF